MNAVCCPATRVSTTTNGVPCGRDNRLARLSLSTGEPRFLTVIAPAPYWCQELGDSRVH
jgi:hypothetical protein